MLFPVNSQHDLGRFVLPEGHTDIHFKPSKIEKIQIGNNLTRFGSPQRPELETYRTGETF